MSTTIKQHFVYRKYLSEWTDDRTTDGKIWAKQKNTTSINPNLMSIAFEKRFYKFEELNEKEILILKKFSGSNNYYKKINEGWITNIINIFDVINYLKKQLGDNFPHKMVDDFLTQMGEDLQSSYENEGIDLLEKLKAEDKSFLTDSEKLMRFYNYLNMQYFRTKKIRNVVLDSISKTKTEFPDGFFQNISGEKIAKILPMIFTTSVTLSVLRLNKKNNISFLKTSGKRFITCDQPVINIAEEFDEKNIPTTLDYYYPLTPYLSIIISNNDKYKDEELNDDQVNYYNEKICKHAERFIFSLQEEDLKNYNIN